MANQFNQEEVILFEQVLEKFESDNTIAKEASVFRQPDGQMQRRGDTVWRPTPQISTVVEGLDITGAYGSITGMSVPATLATIANVPFQMNVLELRDPLQRDRKAVSAAQALSARINRSIADVIKIWGSQTIRVVGAPTGYDDISLVDAQLIEQDIQSMGKTMTLNARDYNKMGGDLASRTLMSRSERALSDTNLGPIATFNTFKTSYTPRMLGQAAAVTVAGAGQKHVPKSTTTAATGETQNVDNRTQALTVNSTVGVAPGDKFTIDGVNAISLINKEDTGQLRTFSVVEIIDASNLRIAPAIVVAGASDAETDYANCSATPANLANINWLNTTTANANPFFVNDSIEVFAGNLAWDEDMAGVDTMRMTTDNGVEIIFAKSGNIDTGVASYRMTMFFGTTNLEPHMNGILLPNQ